MIRRQVLWTASSRLLVVLVTAASGLLSARLLGPGLKGQYAFATLLPSVVSTIAMLAGPQLIIRDFAAYGKVALRTMSLRRVSFVIAIGLALVSGVIGTASVRSSPMWIVVVVNVVISVTLVAQEYRAAVLQASHSFRSLAMFRLAQAVLPGAGMVVGTVLAGLVGALLGFALGTWAAGLVLRASGGGALRVRSLQGDSEIPWSYVGFTSVSLIVLFLAFRLDTLVLAAVSNSREVGFYAVAVSAAEMCLVVPLSLSVVRAPTYAATATLSAKRDMVTIVVLTGAAAVVLGVVAQPLIHLLFGAAYDEAVPALVGLLPGMLGLACFRFIVSIEIARGYKTGVAVAALAVVVVDLVLLFVWAARHGATGAAWAASSSYWVGLAVILVQRAVRSRRSPPRSLR